MSVSRLLALHLESVIGVTALALVAGCSPELDDSACLTVAIDAECPDAADARDQLVGTETCESPVRRVTATGEFIEKRDAYEWDTGLNGGVSTDLIQCCYEARYRELAGQSCMIGRPLMQAGRPVVAASRTGHGWTEQPSPRLEGLSPEALAALAQLWTEIGLYEHASIASFSKVALELMALGAPADLVDRVHSAARDEVRHARLSLALASAYAGSAVEPGPLAVGSMSGTVDLAEFAAATVREGCVGETLAVVIAAEQLAAATDPAVRSVLEAIVRDESVHAELAWATVRWALSVGGSDVRQAVARAFAEAATPELPAIAAVDGAVGHGLVSAQRIERAVALAVQRVVAPAAAELLT
jgi:hypothetical protein